MRTAKHSQGEYNISASRFTQTVHLWMKNLRLKYHYALLKSTSWNRKHYENKSWIILHAEIKLLVEARPESLQRTLVYSESIGDARTHTHKWHNTPNTHERTYKTFHKQNCSAHKLFMLRKSNMIMSSISGNIGRRYCSYCNYSCNQVITKR